jgi:hypothetical protein
MSTQTIMRQESKQIQRIRKLIVLDGAKIVRGHYEQYGRDLRTYNKRLELLDERYFVVDRHMSGGKVYHGRYIRMRYYDEDEDRIKHKYIGKELPIDMAPVGGFPLCPDNPLEGLICQIVGDNVILTEDMYERFIHLFVGHVVAPIEWG